MNEKKIVIVVQGNAVSEILSSGDMSDVSIEVVDLDRPSFETPTEKAYYDKLEERIKQMEDDPSKWEVLY